VYAALVRRRLCKPADSGLRWLHKLRLSTCLVQDLPVLPFWRDRVTAPSLTAAHLFGLCCLPFKMLALASNQGSNCYVFFHVKLPHVYTVYLPC